MGIGGFWGTMYILFIASLVLFLAYIVTRFVGSKYMKTMKGKNITVLESVSLGLDKVLYLVKIGNQHFLISSSGKNINFLSEIKSSNINHDSININESQIMNNNFTKYLDMFKKKIPTNQIDTKNELDIGVENTQENLQNIDKNVEKIRSIFNNIKVSDKDGVE